MIIGVYMENVLYPDLSQYSHNAEYLQAIKKVFSKALFNHSARVLAFRVDLRLPSTCPIDSYDLYALNPMKIFIESLRNQIEAERVRKQREGKVIHACPVRYIWARERKAASKDHYHLMILVSYEYYRGIGDYTSLNRQYLSGKVYVAWGRTMQYMERQLFQQALSDDEKDYMPLVHFCSGGSHVICRNQYGWEGKLCDAYQSATYLAKTATKNYGEGYRCFGTSHR